MNAIWKHFVAPHWPELPSNLRKGLFRLYIALSLPWVVWFGYQVAYYANQPSYWASTRQNLPRSILLLLFVPVGLPILLKIVLWVVQGFARSPNRPIAKTSIRTDLDQLRLKVAEDLSRRPDFVANKYLRTGWLYGKHINNWPRLDDAKLSADQKAKLPASYYQEGGIDPAELGRCFGYGTGDGMIERLVQLQDQIRVCGSIENLVDGLVDKEIIKRLNGNTKRTS